VNAADPSLLDRVRKDAGIPDKLAACHIAKIDGYFIEGHVPGTDIEHLMNEKPDAIGLTVPGCQLVHRGWSKALASTNTTCFSSRKTARKSLQATRQTTIPHRRMARWSDFWQGVSSAMSACGTKRTFSRSPREVWFQPKSGHA
jgi:hypothetical protein